MKPRLLLARLCDLCHYSWKAARANRFPKTLGTLSKDDEEDDDDEPEVIFHYLVVVRMSRRHFAVHRSSSTVSSQREIVVFDVDQ